MYYISKYLYFKSLEQIRKGLNPIRAEQSTSRSSVRCYTSIAPQAQVMLHANDFVQYKTSEMTGTAIYQTFPHGSHWRIFVAPSVLSTTKKYMFWI